MSPNDLYLQGGVLSGESSSGIELDSIDNEELELVCIAEVDSEF